MVRYLLAIFFLLGMSASGDAQSLEVEKDLRAEWLVFDAAEGYTNIGEQTPGDAVYLRISPAAWPKRFLAIHSARPYFIFVNGQLAGEFEGRSIFSADSLATRYGPGEMMIAIYQNNLNTRALTTSFMSWKNAEEPVMVRPDSWLRDFATVAGVLIILFFIFISHLNPKLASDYLSLRAIITLRESADALANARLTNSANVQFYVACSLLLGYYLLLIFQHLPEGYVVPLYFEAHGFWSAIGQWLKLSAVILLVFIMKVLIVFLFTRLFDMRGLTRVHFFNWMRLLLIVAGAATIVMYIYFISRGQRPEVYAGCLIAVIVTLVAWVVILFLKLTGSRGHTMFHLFSYICATELIPLFITIKVLFR